MFSLCCVRCALCHDDVGGSKGGVELSVIAWWRVWTGLIWLGYNAVDGVCEYGNIGFCERRQLSWLAVWVVPSQKGFYCIELVISMHINSRHILIDSTSFIFFLFILY